ncbi:hypothetical protein D3C87_1639860 [compost metagenome]
MKIIGKAEIYFFNKEEGGQDRLIRKNFSTPILFDEDKEQKLGLWSAMIEFISLPNEERKAKADIYLLFYDQVEAPNFLIRPGAEFMLVPRIAKGKFDSIRTE